VTDHRTDEEVVAEALQAQRYGDKWTSARLVVDAFQSEGRLVPEGMVAVPRDALSVLIDTVAQEVSWEGYWHGTATVTTALALVRAALSSEPQETP
jgi:hypothetical protein